MSQESLKPLKFTPSYFFYSLLILCAAYLLFEYFFIPYGVLSADEFVFARHIYDYTTHIPYRDFPPYKTVLGYYLLSIPMFFSHGLLAPIFYIKAEIAVVNIIFILLSCYLASRIFNKSAILLSIFAIVANQLFIVYATDLRVDMLTAWFCLLSVLTLLRNQFKIAGALLGIAFLISQKALWYIFAANMAMFICWYIYQTSLFRFRQIVYFNIAMLAPIILYIFFWSCFASPFVIIYSLFYEAYIQAGISWYLPIYFVCWDAMLRHGPVLFLFWPATVLMLIEKFQDNDQNAKRLFIIAYSFIAIIQYINYKQAFPYNAVLIVPAFYILYAEFFTWILTAKHSNTFNRSLLYILVLYSLFMGSILFLFSHALFKIPTIYYFSILLPLALYTICSNEKNSSYQFISYVIFIGIFLSLGIIYPLLNAVKTSHILNGKYQQANIELTSQLLKNDEKYIGGIPYLYQNDQPIDGMKNLIGPALEYLYEPNDKLATLLLPSLYLAPSNQSQVIADFEREPVKIILNNYRMLYLPSQISNYINDHYQHFYGSIYLYAPIIHASQLTFDLKFTGQYRVLTKRNARIRINNKRVQANQLINLKKGELTSFANRDYRLQLIPNVSAEKLTADFAKDDWVRMLKAIIT